MTTPENMQRLEELFHEAVGLGPQERADFMERIRDSDPELVAAVESLIVAHESSDSLLDSPAYEVAAELIADEPPSPPSLVPGQVVGRYRVTAPIGKGGMGEVYLASDVKLGRRVALKLLPVSFSRDIKRVRRFEQEGRAASALNHPNILTVHESGETEGGVRFIATEFVEGETLRHRITRMRMTLPEILDVSIQVAGALQAAHAAGIVHRDIKPENIMLRPDGYVKVLDFGLAKPTEMFRQSDTSPTDSVIATIEKTFTEPGAVMGTVNYMSPEQARGHLVDARTDVFNLGIVMYEMAAGRMAFAGETAIDTLVSILEKEPPPLDQYAPDLPAEFQRIISKALRKDKEERYQTIKDLLIDLKSLKEELTFEQKLKRSQPPQPPQTPPLTSVPRGAAETAAEAKQKNTDTENKDAVTDTLSQTKTSRGGKSAVVVALTGVLLVAVAISAVALFWPRSQSAPVVSVPPNAAELTVSYWITVQKYRDGKTFREPFRLRDDINFEQDYRIRLHVTSSQSGRLYLLNEGPPAAGGNQTPTFNVLFPSETANNGSALLRENQEIQIPQQSWFQFDAQQGTEKIWLVWAEKDVPELEAVKKFANPKDRGVVSDDRQRTALNKFLQTHSTPGASVASVERNEGKKDTVVRTKGEILVHLIKLEHH